MKRFLLLSLATLMYGQAIAQTISAGEVLKKEDKAGEDALTDEPRVDRQPPPRPQSSVAQTSAFNLCPFTLDIDELIPPDVVTDFTNLHTRLTSDNQTQACRSQGETIGNLLGMMGTRTSGQRTPIPTLPTGPTGPRNPTGPGKAADAVEALGGADLESPPQQPRNPTTAGQTCRDNPVRCEQLITQILEGARSDENGACYGNGAVDTILGVAFQLGGPGIGQIALGVSAIRSIIGLFSSARRNPQRGISRFFSQAVPQRQMETLQACFSTQLYQDTMCRDTYLDCLTSNARQVTTNGFCAGASLSQSGSGGASAGPICQAYQEGIRSNPDNQNIPYNGRSYSKKDLLELCLKDNDENANLSGDDFLIDTTVMSKLYACMAYYTKAHQTANPGIPLSDAILNPIRNRCRSKEEGIETKGGAEVTSWVLQYNLLRQQGAATNTTFARDVLPDVMTIASTFHQNQLQRASYLDVSGVQTAVFSCYYGYGINMDVDLKRRLLRNQSEIVQNQGDSVPARCQNMNACISRGISSGERVILPSRETPIYAAIRPIESLNESFLTAPTDRNPNPHRNRFTSNVGKICYGMAMNQIVDHTSIAANLREQGFDGRTCTRPPIPREERGGILGTDDDYGPTSGQ